MYFTSNHSIAISIQYAANDFNQNENINNGLRSEKFHNIHEISGGSACSICASFNKYSNIFYGLVSPNMILPSSFHPLHSTSINIECCLIVILLKCTFYRLDMMVINAN